MAEVKHQLLIVPSTDLSSAASIELQDQQSTPGSVTLKPPAAVIGSHTIRLPDNAPASIGKTLSVKTITSGTDIQLEWGAGSGTVAESPTGASITISYGLLGQSAAFQLSGTVTIPATHPNIKTLRIEAAGPGSLAVVASSSLVDVPSSGTSVAFVMPQVLRTGNTDNYSVRFVPVDASGRSGTPYVTSVSIAAATVSSVAAGESGVREAESSGLVNLHLTAAPTFAQGPFTLACRLNKGDGNWLRMARVVTGTSGVPIEIGIVPVPTSATGSWQVAVKVVLGSDAAIAGDENYSWSSLPSGWVSSSAQSITTVGSPAATIASNAAFGTIKYAQASNGWMWGWASLGWQLNLSVIQAWATYGTVQKGHYNSGTWVPATDHEGVERPFCGVGRDGTGDSKITVSGTTGTVSVPNGMNWPVPPAKNPDGSTNVDRIYKFKVYVRSMEGNSDTLGGSGTATLQTGCWPSSAAFYDVTPADQAGNIDLTKTIASTRSSAFGINGSGQLDVSVDATRISSIDAAILAAASESSLHVATSGKLDVTVDATRITSITPAVVAAIHNSAEFEVVGGYIVIKTLNVNKLVGNSIDVGSGGLSITAGGSLTITGGGNIVINGPSSKSVTLGSTGLSVVGLIHTDSGLTVDLGGTFGGAVQVRSLLVGVIPGATVIDDHQNAAFASLTVGGTNVMTAIAAKADSSALSSYLTTATAASTYETQSHASSTYQPLSSAFTQSAADGRYMPIAGPTGAVTDNDYVVAADGWWHSYVWTAGCLTSFSKGT